MIKKGKEGSQPVSPPFRNTLGDALSLRKVGQKVLVRADDDATDSTSLPPDVFFKNLSQFLLAAGLWESADPQLPPRDAAVQHTGCLHQALPRLRIKIRIKIRIRIRISFQSQLSSSSGIMNLSRE